MSASRAIEISKQNRGTVAILLEGVPVVIGERQADELDARGVAIAWLYKRTDGIVSIPNNVE
jgi:hypothetical protein